MVPPPGIANRSGRSSLNFSSRFWLCKRRMKAHAIYIWTLGNAVKECGKKEMALLRHLPTRNCLSAGLCWHFPLLVLTKDRSNTSPQVFRASWPICQHTVDSIFRCLAFQASHHTDPTWHESLENISVQLKGANFHPSDIRLNWSKHLKFWLCSRERLQKQLEVVKCCKCM